LIDVEREYRCPIGRPLAALEGAEAGPAAEQAISTGARRAWREVAATEGARAWRFVAIAGGGAPDALLSAPMLRAAFVRAEPCRTARAERRAERLAAFRACRLPEGRKGRG
jgi:hypothetical protein